MRIVSRVSPNVGQNLRVSTLLVAVLLSVAVAACSGPAAAGGAAPAVPPASPSEAAAAAGAQSVRAPEKAEVVIAVTGSGVIGNVPAVLADILGYYKAEGITVKFPSFASSTATATAVTGGTADFGTSALQDVIKANNQGGRLVATAAMNQFAGLVLLVNTKNKNATQKDLGNMTIGVSGLGATTDLFLRNILSKNGVDPTSAKVVAVGLGSTAITALTNDQIQAVVQTDPFVAQLVDSGQATILVDGRTAAGTRAVYGGLVPGSGLMTTQDFTQANPRTVAAVSRATARGLQYMQTHTAEEVTDLLPGDVYYPDGNKAQFVKSLKDNKEVFGGDGGVTMEMATATVTALKVLDPQADFSKLNVSKTFDSSWAAK